MKIARTTIVFILFILTSLTFGQDMLTFDDQGWSNDQVLPNNFITGDYTFSSTSNFYTNYGYDFNVNQNSLYYVFQNPSTDRITITTKNSELVKFISIGVYQVSETSDQNLIIEGWDGSKKLYTKSFLNINSWQTLNLNFDKINKVIIKLSSSSSTSLTDFNFDNFSFEKIPLPVELTSFSATCGEEYINLDWQTATEINNFGFEVERLKDEKINRLNDKWEKIGFIKGHGTSTISINYSFQDNSAVNGTNYKYRMKQIDENGEYNYSDEIEVTANFTPKSFNLSQNYPNPFNPSTNIQFAITSNQFVSLKIYDIVGHEIATLVNEKKLPGKYEVQFNAASLPSGVYIYKLSTDGYSSIKKMILLK